MTPEQREQAARETAVELERKLIEAAKETIRQCANVSIVPLDESVDLIQAAILAADRTAREEEQKRCAQICCAISAKHWRAYKHGSGEHRGDPHYQGLSDGADECAEAIRAGVEPAVVP